MISFKKPFYIFTNSEHWFEKKTQIADAFRLTAYRHLHHNLSKKNLFYFRETEYTLTIDLNEFNPEFLKNVKPQYKRDINNGIKHGIKCYTANESDKFYQFYLVFAKKKGIYITPQSVMEELKENIVFSFAELDGKLLCAHSHVLDQSQGICRLFQSASVRLEEETDKKHVSYANKLLTIFDLSTFKNEGFKIYDFGGYDADENHKEMLGINRFKMNFGGELKTTCNYYSIPYFLLNKFARLMDRRYR